MYTSGNVTVNKSFLYTCGWSEIWKWRLRSIWFVGRTKAENTRQKNWYLTHTHIHTQYSLSWLSHSKALRLLHPAFSIFSMISRPCTYKTDTHHLTYEYTYGRRKANHSCSMHAYACTPHTPHVTPTHPHHTPTPNTSMVTRATSFRRSILVRLPRMASEYLSNITVCSNAKRKQKRLQ